MASHRLLSSLLTVMTLSPGASAQIDTAIVDHSSPMPGLYALTWENPAMLSHRFDTSLSSLEGSYNGSSRERYGEFRADAYIRRPKLTLAAQALYDNGALHNVRFCENVDVADVYPYLTYDAIGGNMNLERYGFGGAVDVKIGERWTVGASGNYLAGLYYRNVDPRPRDVTGRLDLTAGASVMLGGNYAVGLSADYQKYKQTCDITFMSELGETTIYHLTGLGTHYSRFAGQGQSSYYNGNRFGGTLSLYPSDVGVYASVTGNIMKITHILSDLNKLPMSRTDTRSFRAEAGYKSRSWGVAAFGGAMRRHGYENVFGDAATGQYPLIATLGMDAISVNRFGMRGAKEWKIKRSTLWVVPEAEYFSFREQYNYPRREMKFSTFNIGAKLKVASVLPRGFVLTAEAEGGFYLPSDSRLTGVTTDNPDLKPFVDILTEEFDAASSTRRYFSCRADVAKQICAGRYAVGLTAHYSTISRSPSVMKLGVFFKF